ncbi:MAG: DUF4397 domain-containing protein, partial [Myxococcota bacterium]
IQGGVAGQPLEVAVYADLREQASDEDSVDYAFVHASPDAPAVSGGRQETYATAAPEPLFTNASYGAGGGTLGYVGVEPGTLPFDVYPTSGDLRPLASLQTSSGDVIPAESGLTAFDTAVLVAIGLLEPVDGEPGLQVLAVTPDGRSGVLDAAARLQVVHAAIAAPSSVDVYFGEMGATSAAAGTEIVEDLGYQNATPFRSYVAGVPGMLQVTQANQPTLAVNEPFTPMMGQIARLVAVGGADGQDLTVSVVNGAEVATGGAGTIDLQLFHASTNAPTPVDVYLTASGTGIGDLAARTPEIAGLAFGAGSDAVGRMFVNTIFSVAMGGGTTSLVDFSSELAEVFELDEDGSSFFAVITGDASGVATDLDLIVIAPSSERDPNDGTNL